MKKRLLWIGAAALVLVAGGVLLATGQPSDGTALSQDSAPPVPSSTPWEQADAAPTPSAGADDPAGQTVLVTPEGAAPSAQESETPSAPQPEVTPQAKLPSTAQPEVTPQAETTSASQPVVTPQAETTPASQPEATPQAESTPASQPEATPAPSPTPQGQNYIINTNSGKFHYPSCSSVKQMKESNKQSFTGTRDELIARGYSPCGNCHP